MALFFSLCFIPTGFAHATRLSPNAPDSTHTAAEPASADTLHPAPAAAPADTLPQPRIHPRDANGRLTDFTVAPGLTWHYDKPRPFRWALHIPRDLGQFPAYTFRKENTGTFIGMAVGSLALWVADQAIIDWSQDVGRQLGLTPKSTQRTLFSVPFHIG